MAEHRFPVKDDQCEEDVSLPLLETGWESRNRPGCPGALAEGDEQRLGGAAAARATEPEASERAGYDGAAMSKASPSERDALAAGADGLLAAAARCGPSLSVDSRERSLFLWEARALVQRGPDGRARCDTDGGLRWERRDAAERCVEHRYLVGAEPEDGGLLLAGGTARGSTRRCGERMRAAALSAEALLADHDASFGSLDAGLTSLTRAGRIGAASLHVAGAVRHRILVGGDGSARVEVERGVRYQLRNGGGDALHLWGGESGADVPWSSDPERWLAARVSRLDPTAGRESGAAWTPRPGPLVMLPRAAAWWGHEMAHAALEGWSVPGDGALRIVEEPPRAPWPAGFLTDDHGDASGARCLWGGSKGQPLELTGLCRRPSVRDAARPSLAATRVEATGTAYAELAGIPDGTPVVRRIRAGRFDPRAGQVLAAIEVGGVMSAGEIVRAHGSAVALVGAEQGWRSALPGREAAIEDADFAPCTRLGLLLPVMVGAPTIVLEVDRVLRWESP